MLFFPISTDAPIYHWPFVTAGVMVVNVVCFLLTGCGDFEAHPNWMIEYGNGLNPVEWIGAAFFHFGWLHLIGNMIFLWGFGIVVEGKIGWWRYLLVYAGIMMAHGFVEQAMMLGYDGLVEGSAGASGVIYGLLAIAMVWAPKNDVTCFLLILYRAKVFEMSIYAFAMFYIVLQFLVAALFGFQMSSEVIHLLGAALGFGIGIVMLTAKWVDCENWDLIAVMRGTYGNEKYEPYLHGSTVVAATAAPKRRRSRRNWTAEEIDDAEDQPEKLGRSKRERKITRLLSNNKAQAAFNELQKLRHFVPGAELERTDLRAMILGLYKAKRWANVVPLLEEYINRFPDRADGMRLRLAAVMTEVQQRPKAALRIMEPIHAESLKGADKRKYRKLTASAEQMIDNGVIELEGKPWFT